MKFVYLLPLNCMRDRILSLVSVQGTNGGQNQEKLIQCFIIPVYLMWWLSILSKLDCFSSIFHYLLCNILIINWLYVIICPRRKYWNCSYCWCLDSCVWCEVCRGHSGDGIVLAKRKKSKYKMAFTPYRRLCPLKI